MTSLICITDQWIDDRHSLSEVSGQAAAVLQSNSRFRINSDYVRKKSRTSNTMEECQYDKFGFCKYGSQCENTTQLFVTKELNAKAK